ncbi:ribbon-helix-helix domain-containing protein [Microbacterium candidum]|uniref:Ribbon-helix-helix domain-containing protein n=1 Tax=Microbacterium candidum TaxID=3041922 RepID=A0ABT7MYG3_9MICO|nr:ribbon-helix-helix domain-containing protein [Microbacterium sp. ASV49]MDL9979471.1 ribbon-helix-helix domain-containing protein [Microbacterium sp. ASV49]
MSFTKVSLSLDEHDVAFLDAETADGHFPSRSAAVQAAVRLLRESRLADAYAEAYGEWNESGEAEAWAPTSLDGIA